MAKILIIEDDEFMADELEARLLKDKYIVEIARDGDDGLYRLKHYEFDIAIVDWNLPGISGVEICRRIRANKPQIPLLMLTSRNATFEKIEGLDAGAFDYLVKPPLMDELTARIRSLLRRPPQVEIAKVSIGDLEFFPEKRELLCNERTINLSASEFDILLVLARSPSQELDSVEIARRIGKEDTDGLRESMRTHIKNARHKLEKAGSSTCLEFRRSLGYILLGKNDIKR